MQQVTVLLIDTPKDGGLQESALVLDQEEPDRPTALGGSALQTLNKTCCTSIGSVR